MNWDQLKKHVYFIDGSLRDILVKGTTKEDWLKWSDLINLNYDTTFHIHETNTTKKQIDIKKVFRSWEDANAWLLSATVLLDDITFKTYFFTDKEIENDLDPKEISSIAKHKSLIEYMSNIARVLNKPVLLTPENTPDIELICINTDSISFMTKD